MMISTAAGVVVLVVDDVDDFDVDVVRVVVGGGTGVDATKISTTIKKHH